MILDIFTGAHCRLNVLNWPYTKFLFGAQGLSLCTVYCNGSRHCYIHRDVRLSWRKRRKVIIKLFYLWLWGFMMVVKVRWNWDFNELVLHAALRWFVHIDGCGGGCRDEDKSHGMKTSKVRAEMLPSGKSKRDRLCFIKAHASRSDFAVNALLMKRATPALPQGPRDKKVIE